MEELLKIYNLPLNALLEKASKLCSNEIELCSLISAKTGKCSENCRYCAQSVHVCSDVFSHPLLEIDEVIKAAKEAKENGAIRFAIVTSGRGPCESDMPKMCEMIQEINKLGLKSCASLGLLTYEQAKMLKDVGLVRYHHNINTSKSYYSEVSTSHTYKDRLKTIENIKAAGLELCCGVILGLGESVEDRIEMVFDLSQIAPESIPVNVLMPIEGTPFEGYLDKIDEIHIMRSLAVFKIANPNSIVRLAGGRNTRLNEMNRELALQTCVEGILIGNYLTKTGISPEEDIKTLEKLGRNLCTTT